MHNLLFFFFLKEKADIKYKRGLGFKGFPLPFSPNPPTGVWGHASGVPLPVLSKNAGRPRRPERPVSLRSHRGAFGPRDAGSLKAGSRSCLSKRLPPVMRESPIGLRHPVRVLFLLDRFALALRREDQLGGEALRHVLLAPGAAERDQPAHPQP